MKHLLTLAVCLLMGCSCRSTEKPGNIVPYPHADGIYVDGRRAVIAGGTATNVDKTIMLRLILTADGRVMGVWE